MTQNLGISGDKKERQTINWILDYREHTGGTRGEVGREGEQVLGTEAPALTDTGCVRKCEITVLHTGD